MAATPKYSMDIKAVESAVDLVTHLRKLRGDKKSVAEDVKEWTRVTFRGENGVESQHSVQFGGYDGDTGDYDQRLARHLREEAVKFLDEEIKKCEEAIKNL